MQADSPRFLSFYASTAADFLPLLNGPLRRCLIDGASLERITALASRIPASSFGYFGFERRLGGDAGADFSINLSAAGVNWLRGIRRWPQVRSIVGGWRRDVDSAPGNVWLEFDTSEAHSDKRPPNVFLSLNRSGSAPFAKSAHAARLVRDGLSVAGSAMSSAAAGLAQRCVDGCPETVRRLHFGFMFARNAPSLRISAVPLPYYVTPAFLRMAEWPGDLHFAAGAARLYAALCDDFGVQIGSAAHPDCSVGFELFYRGDPANAQPEQERRWIALLDRLVTDRLCGVAEREALLAWPSRTEFEAPLIERLIAAVHPSSERLLDGTLHTGLHYVKLTINAGRRISAKAYFGAILAPRRTREPRENGTCP